MSSSFSLLDCDKALAKTERITLTATVPFKRALQVVAANYTVTVSEVLRAGVFRYVVTQYPIFTDMYLREFTQLVENLKEQDEQ